MKVWRRDLLTVGVSLLVFGGALIMALGDRNPKVAVAFRGC
jgi:hypothetical protein